MVLGALQILGTFITEWEGGSILCELLLWTEQSAEAAALQLANIAAFYGFDGWLLNIENPILHRHVPNLVHFIRYSEVTLLLPPALSLFPLSALVTLATEQLGLHMMLSQVLLPQGALMSDVTIVLKSHLQPVSLFDQVPVVPTRMSCVASNKCSWGIFALGRRAHKAAHC